MESNDMPEESVILFQITNDQAEKIAEHFGKNIEEHKLEEYEICEMLDKIIDEEL